MLGYKCCASALMADTSNISPMSAVVTFLCNIAL